MANWATTAERKSLPPPHPSLCHHREIRLFSICSRTCDSPRLIEYLRSKRVRDIACGSAHSACITSNGELYTWGLGEYGRLSHGDNASQLRPKLVKALQGKPHLLPVIPPPSLRYTPPSPHYTPPSPRHVPPRFHHILPPRPSVCNGDYSTHRNEGYPGGLWQSRCPNSRVD